MNSYDKYIYQKYNVSKNDYKKIFKENDNYYDFLLIYENLNVYPTFPEPILMTLINENEIFNENDLASEQGSGAISPHIADDPIGDSERVPLGTHDDEFNMDTISSFKKLLNEKINEFTMLYGEKKEVNDNLETDKIRRYFDYEIRDILKKKLNKDITNAWIKMYEILVTYEKKNDPLIKINNTETEDVHKKAQEQYPRILQMTNNKIIETFHICEHPGKFIFAVNDYIKKMFVNSKHNFKHSFVFQSLNPKLNIEAFPLDKKLIALENNKLDYGINNTGDITQIDNIQYYIDKYNKHNFKLITSDCGMDFSEDFTKQEEGLFHIFLSALIIAIGLSSNDTVYVFKMFSLLDIKTIQLLYIACKFFSRVDILRLLTTKGFSGEIYCVCRYGNKKINKNEIIEKLFDLINHPNKLIYKKYDKLFIERITKINKLLTVRRILSINQLIFRIVNYNYVNDNKQILKIVKGYVDYYTNYFIDYIGMSEPSDKLKS